MYTIRTAHKSDIEAVVVVQRKSLADTIGVNVREFEEEMDFYTKSVFVECRVLVAEVDGKIVGYIGYKENWVDHLRVDTAYHGSGIGKALLNKAKADYSYLQLWCFQHIPARKFYLHQDFVEVAYTDGDNDENLPDVRMEWRR